jgi:hypothetical protein
MNEIYRGTNILVSNIDDFEYLFERTKWLKFEEVYMRLVHCSNCQ